jgi:uncharacterized damage-inducible protein DinB
MISFLAELEQEAQITARVLARVPDNHLAWKPHEKSMTLGQLALHTARIPGGISAIAANDNFQLDPANFGKVPQPASHDEIMTVFADSLATARAYLGGLTSEQTEAIWRMSVGEKQLLSMPREWVLRSIMFNHMYHHRGQLSVYLRLLDIPVPIIYGASADETPFN